MFPQRDNLKKKKSTRVNVERKVESTRQYKGGKSQQDERLAAGCQSNKPKKIDLKYAWKNWEDQKSL